MTRLLVLGDLNLDVFAARPDAGTPVDVRGGEGRSPVRVRPGGSAGTFAWTAATRGADVRFIGSVGRDIAGDLLVEWLRRVGVETDVERPPDATGVVLALQQADQRTMICSRSANDGLATYRITEDTFDGVDHLHVSGYAFLSDAQRPVARAIIAEARTRGIAFSVDPPPAALIEAFGSERLLALMEGASFAFPNLAEGRVLTGATDPQRIADSLVSRFAYGALTLGEDGAVAWTPDAQCTAEADRIETSDNVGAGDTFAAAFIVAWYASRNLQTAVHAGCTAAHDLLHARGFGSA